MSVVFKHSIPLNSLLEGRSLNSLVFQPEFDAKTAAPIYYLDDDKFLSYVQVCRVVDPIKGWKAILSYDVAKHYYAGEVIQKESLFLNEVIIYEGSASVGSQAKHSFWVSSEDNNEPLMDDDSDNFPYVVLPHMVSDALLYLPPQKPFKQEAPIEPQGHPVKDSVYRFIVLSPLLLLSLVSYIISIVIRSPLPFWLGFILGIAGLIIMAKWVIPKIKLVPSSEMTRKEEEYERKLTAYERNREEYGDALERYEVLSPLYGKCSRSDYIQHSLEVCLKQYSPPTIDQDLPEIKHGPSEQAFIRFLSGVMTEEYELLGAVKTLHTSSFDPIYYFPDIAIREKKTGLMIDIEIDEPYIAKSGTPIHCYRGSRGSSDEDRNRALASDNWIIFHFTEEQTIRFPEICWAYVKTVCSYFVSCVPYQNPYLLGFCQKRWDYFEALKMAESNYRLTYLPSSVRESIRVIQRRYEPSSVKEDDDLLPF